MFDGYFIRLCNSNIIGTEIGIRTGGYDDILLFVPLEPVVEINAMKEEKIGNIENKYCHNYELKTR